MSNAGSDFIRVIQILLIEVGIRNFPKMKLVTVNSTLNFSKLQKETKCIPCWNCPGLWKLPSSTSGSEVSMLAISIQS